MSKSAVDDNKLSDQLLKSSVDTPISIDGSFKTPERWIVHRTISRDETQSEIKQLQTMLRIALQRHSGREGSAAGGRAVDDLRVQRTSNADLKSAPEGHRRRRDRLLDAHLQQGRRDVKPQQRQQSSPQGQFDNTLQKVGMRYRDPADIPAESVAFLSSEAQRLTHDPLRRQKAVGGASQNQEKLLCLVGWPGMPRPAAKPKYPEAEFTSQDDDLLSELRSEKNATWRQVMDFFPGRNLKDLKARWMKLEEVRRNVMMRWEL